MLNHSEFYKIIETKIGKLCILWQYENKRTRIIQIILPGFSLKSLKSNHPKIQNKTNGIIDALASKINRYIQGKTAKFKFNKLQLQKLGNFQKKVLMLTAKIPYGSVSTYGAIAKKLGIKRGGAQAVGQALAKNPFPIIIPCHRVIKSDGTSGGFGGNTNLKKRLLAIEGIILKS